MALPRGSMSEPEDRALTPLRPDLLRFAAPESASGAPLLTVFDPISGRYARLGWLEQLVLARWRPGETARSVSRRLRDEALAVASPVEVAEFGRALEARGWLAFRPRPRAERRGLPSLLSVRLALVHPDGALRAALPAVRWLGHPATGAAFAVLAVFGLAGLARRWEEFALPARLFTPEGLVLLGVALWLVKLVHELGHAFVARAHGVPVRSCGVVVYVGFPVPYTDVTDAWRLADRAPRVAIALAGMAAELGLAILALAAWNLSPPGALRELIAVACTVGLAKTVLVNLNPGARFDGYYALADAWGLDNLRARAIGALRWVVHRHLFGVLAPPAEPPGRRLGLAAFGAYAWAYQLAISLALGLAAYTMMAKLLGVAVIALVLWGGVLLPAWRESRRLLSAVARRPRPRAFFGFAAVAAALLALAWPRPQSVLVPACLVPAAEQIVYATVSGEIVQLGGALGAALRAGDPVLEVRPDALDVELAVLARELEILDARRGLAQLAPSRTAELPQLAEQHRAALAQLRRAQAQRAQSVVRAQHDGEVIAWDPLLRLGQSIAARRAVGRIAATGPRRALAYATADDRDRLRPGMPARFVPASGATPLHGQVARVGATRQLRLDHPQLGAPLGGPIAAHRRSDGGLEPVEALYAVEVALGDAEAPLGIVGWIEVPGPARSVVLDWLRSAWSTALRESGF